jgi:hypothetical protein
MTTDYLQHNNPSANEKKKLVNVVHGTLNMGTLVTIFTIPNPNRKISIYSSSPKIKYVTLRGNAISKKIKTREFRNCILDHIIETSI